MVCVCMFMCLGVFVCACEYVCVSVFVMYQEVGMDMWTEEGARTHALPPFPRLSDNQLIICGLSEK